MDPRRVTRLSHLVVAVLLTVWCLFLSFWRLDSVELYRDEADAALVAGSMVQTGHWIPSYFDGRQLLLHAPDGSDSDTRFVPVPPGWLQFYVEAASIRVLGTGTWQARFPFALLCPLAMLVLYA